MGSSDFPPLFEFGGSGFRESFFRFRFVLVDDASEAGVESEGGVDVVEDDGDGDDVVAS